MSYDLMVFEPEAAPKEHQKFLAWYREQTKWNEGHSYGDPTITSERLRNWFLEVAKIFPSLNGVMTEEDLPEDEASATDYSIGRHMIYACFAWSKESVAYQTVFDQAAKHNIGFFNVSSSMEEVWLPEDGKLSLVHQKRSSLKDKLRKFLTRS